jgi:acyl dehydratase
MAMDIDIRTLRDRVGEEIAVSDWTAVTQDRINQFADATGDHQWIHVDLGRAQHSPFQTTIAHGFLTLSLISALLRSAINPTGLRMAINYGLNRVRFIAPVPSGARIRGRFTLASLEDTGGAIQATWSATIERDGGDKPVCAAEWLVRYYPA